MLTFKLDDSFIEDFGTRTVPFGFQSGPGLTVGELVYVRTYSNKKEDGRKERWHETARRVVEGSFSVQKDHILEYVNGRWDDIKAQASAKEMYNRLYNFKFWVPGRGLENMGTPGVNGWGYSDRLYNCAFVDTTDPVGSLARLMAMSMRGVGVGFNTNGAGSMVFMPEGHFPYTIPDSTEGWVKAVELLLRAFFVPHQMLPVFNSDRIRKKGAIINSGGIAPGPGPLMESLEKLKEVLSRYHHRKADSRLIVDLANIIGKAVVSGGKRRTALLALGKGTDEDFIQLKDWTLPVNNERMERENGWAWASNNSIQVLSTDMLDYNEYAERQVQREPGLFVTDLVQNYGRMVDGYQPGLDRAIGTNPCGEISLEPNETCNLVSINLMRQDDMMDFLRTIKYAYLYAKSVTLMPTSWPETNEVSMRNRRIGCSVSGVAEFVEKYGWNMLRAWLDAGYKEIRRWDKIYSEWLCVRESVKVTTVKPEGSAALLSASTPGVHYPVESTYIRRIQFESSDPLLSVLSDAGYNVEPANGHGGNTMVVEIPTQGPHIRNEKQVSVYEKLALATMLQEYWSDNMVSFTLTFKEEEKDDLAAALKMNWGRFKSLSCAPIYEVEGSAKEMQLPYEAITPEKYEELTSQLKAVDLERIYEGEGVEAVGDKYCEGDRCAI